MNNQENNRQQNTEQNAQQKNFGPTVAVRPPLRESPLGKPELRPAMGTKEALLAAFALLICFVGATIALAADSGAVTALSAAAVIIIGLIWVCRTGKKANCILMALIPTGLWFFTGAMALSSLYIGGLCVTVATARLLSHKRGVLASLVITVAFACSFVIAGAGAALSLFGFALAGIVLALLSMSFAPRVSTICAMTAALLAAFIATGLLTVVTLKGTCSGTAIMEVIGDLRDRCVAALDEVIAGYAKFAAAATEETLPTIDHNTSVAAVNAVFNLLPAFAVLYCMIPAFFAQIIFVLSCENEQEPVYKGVLLHRFALSPMAAIIFMLCEICALFAWNDNAFAAVIENVYLIMLPGLFLVGMFNLLAMFRPRTPSRMPTVILILSCCIMPAFIIPLLGFFGAYLIVRGFIAMLIAARRNRRNGP